MRKFFFPGRSICSCLLLLILAQTVQAQTKIVLVDGASSNPTPWACYSNNVTASGWLTACNNLDAAIVAAYNFGGAQVWVKKGTYKPTTDPLSTTITDNRRKAFSLKNGVAIYGGFAGTETALSQCNPAVNETILSGDIGTPGNKSDNSYQVVISITNNNTAVLGGFTIRDGNANIPVTRYEPLRPRSDCGGGMFTRGSSCLMNNCKFVSNSSDFSGGAMFNEQNSHPVLTNCTFTSNIAVSSGFGGAISNQSSSPLLTNCTFTSNNATYKGGAMYNESSTLTLTNCVFLSNTSYSDGGGITNYTSTVVLTNCIFSSNSSRGGTGISNERSSSVLINCTLASNSHVTNGPGWDIFNYTGSTLKLDNCIVWSAVGSNPSIYENGDNPPIVNNSILAGNYTYNGVGTMKADPQFVNAADPDGADNIFGCITFLSGSIVVVLFGDGLLDFIPLSVHLNGSQCKHMGSALIAPPLPGTFHSALYHRSMS